MTKTKSEEVRERLEKVITQGGQFPNAFAVTEALLQWNSRQLKKLVDKFKELPEDKRRALGIAANLLLTVLENELGRRTKRRRRK